MVVNTLKVRALVKYTGTGTLVVVDQVLTCSAVLARGVSTIVDIDLTVLTLVAKTGVYIKEHVYTD